jgi:predicted transcriptional regulator YdeE
MLMAYPAKTTNQIEPARSLGIWKPDPNVDYSNPENHTKRLYFFGVEVQNTDGVPASCIIKDLPESTFAVFREREHGSPKYEWLHEAGHTPDREFQQKFALDLEIYDDIDAGGLEWDVIIPIVNK